MEKAQIFYVACVSVGLVLMLTAVGCGFFLYAGRLGG